VSPEPGVFREKELESHADRQEAMETLIAMSRAAEDDMRALARRLAGRVVVQFAQAPSVGKGGIGKLHTVPFRTGMDIDLDRSLDALVEARATSGAPSADALVGQAWTRRATSVCLLVDRSGSMGGGRVLAAVLAAAAIAQRTEDDYSVLAFADDVLVLKGQRDQRTPEAVVDDLLTLVGYGMTDMALALRAARDQLALSSAQRRVVVLLSDGRATCGDDPLPEAAQFDELHVLSPAGENPDARLLAQAGRGRYQEVTGPLDVPSALSALMR
jgi:Mg-chelatase subunit ChlD